MRRLLVLLALAACDGAMATSSSAAPGLAADPAGPRPTRHLRVAARYARLAVPIAVAHDGRRWLGAVGYELVTYDGEREVGRWPVPVVGHDAHLRRLTNGGWLAGTTILDRDGKAVFGGDGWAQRYGRFGSAKAMAVSPDGRIAIVDGADSPSACLCDRERGTAGGSDGALVRLTFVEGRVVERVLAEHGDRREYAVAASPTAIAAVDGLTLSVWPAAGDGPPVTATLTAPSLDSLAWAGDRFLIGTRYVGVDRTDIVVLDRDAGYQPVQAWPVDGLIRDLEVRPDGAEIAVAFTRYTATDHVWVDERRVAIFALDGTRRAQVDTDGYPGSLSWSPRGDALLVATTGNKPGDAAVIRYLTR